jgi:hypothetical protein
MRRLSVIMLVGAIIFSAGNLMAQKLKSGDLTILKGQSVLNIQYDYSQFKVGKKSAEEYVTDGIAERNKKKPGSGDEWAEKWKSDRTERFHPAFEKFFNLILSHVNTIVKEDATDAKYTLIVKMTFLEPGFQSGVSMISKATTMNMTIDVVETTAPDKVLATIEYDKIPGHSMFGLDYDAGSRIQGCYERAGEEFADLFYKKGLK